MQAEGLWSFDQFHPCLIGHVVAFAIVALLAGGHQIIPVGTTAAGFWDDVIESQVGRCVNFATILACVVIAQEDIFAR